MNQSIKNKTIFIAMCLAGVFIFQLGRYFLIGKSSRDPAAIPRIYDYSHLEGSALKRASQDRLIGAAKVIVAGRAAGIELGHFVTKNSDGRNVGACEIYDKVELTFLAGDMAVSGAAPAMKISGPCVPGDDINVISPILIPFDHILNSPVHDKSIADFSDQSVTVTFENVSDSWPHMWILQSAKLTSDRADEVKADENDILRVLGKAPALEWQ
jgi:hypothetical protein